MNNFSFLLSLWTAKILSLLISLSGIGQASNFPGKIALKIKKDIIQFFKIKKETKIVLITGTNGKSTTCGLLASILQATGQKVLYNKSGANLLSGIVTAFCHYSNIFGHIKFDCILLEVDEATLPLLTLQIKPDVIAVTNLFRDQLDRFGELDTTAKLIEKGINNNKNTIIILNADDAKVAFLRTVNKKIFYGIDLNGKPALETNYTEKSNNTWLSDSKETTMCPHCKSDLVFSTNTLAHLGNYKCPKCNLERPHIDFLATKIKADHLTTNFDIFGTGFENTNNNFFLSQIGLFNLYNAICSTAIAKSISNVTPMQIQKAFQAYSTIFGRGEKIIVKTPHQGVSTAWVYLIKNPTGTTETLKTLSNFPNTRFLIAINDNYADGRDVSWLWDARFDFLSNHKKEIFVSGKRAYDMALRLKYANIKDDLIKVNENIVSAINQSLKTLEENETLYILPTYTVLLEMQHKGLCKSSPL